MANTFIGVDPGCEVSGISVIRDGVIVGAWNLKNEHLYSKITPYVLGGSYTIAIEDIRPYALRINMQVINTCKQIGEMVYRLRDLTGLNVVMVTRNEVKKWIFDTYPDVVIPLVEKKIQKKWVGRKPTFVFVDDRIVTEVMKHIFQISKPSAGKGYQYGLKEHSWQALACAAYLMISTS